VIARWGRRAQEAEGSGRPAVFLDRDGTVIRDERYLADPNRVALIEGAAAAIARLRVGGYAVVVVTNQSGLARGLITPAQYAAVSARVDTLLAGAGARLDATYMCPHHPDVDGVCDCRKPAPGLFTRAASDHGLDLRRSVLIGDQWRDIAAASVLGAQGLLVVGPETAPADIERARSEADVAPSLAAAADRILTR
jgi:D-glycero-D-manno-heptose 1,7-bisphosphate phosphatase